MKAGSYFVHCCFFEFVFQDFDSAPVSLHLKVKKLPLSALTRRENYQLYIVAKGIATMDTMTVKIEIDNRLLLL